MTIRIQDTLTRESRPLETLEPGVVRMYVCGPTVYDDCHIGHLMGPVVFDTIARWLRAREYEVRFVNNITDIDDKIINRAAATGEDWKSIADRYTAQYLDFLTELNVVTVTDNPRCTDYVDGMVRFIEDLISTDRAYETSDGVYYDVEKQDGYGKLSGRKLEDMQAGARVEASLELRHPADFALWKKAKAGEPSWPSPWGEGRPGWHIECSVMSSDLLGGEFDIHGGGDDLKFPHHENEIAQSEAHGDRFARLWMHNGLIQYGGRKIAKSDPRMKDADFAQQFQARWLIDRYGAPAVRFFLVRTPYNRPIDFEPGVLDGARKGLVRMLRQLGASLDEPVSEDLLAVLTRDLDPELSQHRDRFTAAMDADFNTGEAIAELFTLLRRARELEGGGGEEALLLARDLGRVIGLFQPGDLAAIEAVGAAGEQLAPVVDALLELRTSAREAKDYATADGFRDLLAATGIVVHDAAGETTWEVDRPDEGLLGQLVEGALELRKAARERKDFQTADGIRDRLTAAGIEILDGSDGSNWRPA